ncbi:ATP-grasp fold amidoligase family protein [Salinicoccus sp. ID82-1]|uniref:ATP-grasp fold amidoligase family protein n=1 Tax=Salinicoccus sp. ID82-1 TaxID=2820269 RepID=UPI001F45F70C|nr:ATP-grasp fold amidoligase family protein [Salinicoccus sp. ID82-1]
MKRILKLVKRPSKVLLFIIKKSKLLRYVPDKLYLRIYYFIATKEKLNLENPKSFNEKLQWLKINDRNSKYNSIVDKYEVREYVSKKIGKEYLIPLYGVYKRYEDIDFDALPSQFVLKSTHTSGHVYICNDKNKINHTKLKSTVDKWLKKNLYHPHREWPYKDVEPRIVCEKLMVDESGNDLKDYKFFVFHGEPKVIQVDFNRYINHKRNIYDLDWNLLPLKIEIQNDPNVIINKPQNLDKMLELAKKLGEDFTFIRADLYSINDKIYFGELTFFPGAGYYRYSPPYYEKLKGEWITLPQS